MSESRVLLTMVLTTHQRMDDGSCLCGWTKLGNTSWADHVADCYEAEVADAS
jgi:hypothetical protein